MRPATIPNRERLVTFLKEHPGSYFCDECLAHLIPITSRYQVNQLTRPLEFGREFRRRVNYTCAHCGRDRKCVAYVAQ